MGPEQFKEYSKLIHNLKYYRGHFIELIIQIEEYINEIVEHSLISEQSKFRSVFTEKILNSRSISLKIKIDLLKAIVKEGGYLNQKEQKNLSSSLDKLITERNKWAHGPIFYQQLPTLKFETYLKYINRRGQLVEQKLTEKYFEDIDSELKTIHERIEKLLKKTK